MISLIAAIGKNNELGKNNQLIWHLKKDLAYFQKTTLNHKVIMGLNTYLSIGKPLPNRQNIVLTTHSDLIKNTNVIIYNDLDTLIKNEINTEEVFIIGGSKLYRAFYPLADKLYLTEILASDLAADTYFPQIKREEWDKKTIQNVEEDGIKYSFNIYERKRK